MSRRGKEVPQLSSSGSPSKRSSGGTRTPATAAPLKGCGGQGEDHPQPGGGSERCRGGGPMKGCGGGTEEGRGGGFVKGLGAGTTTGGGGTSPTTPVSLAAPTAAPHPPPPIPCWPGTGTGGSSGQSSFPQYVNPWGGYLNLLDEFITEDELLDDVISETVLVLKASVESLGEEASDHRLRARSYIKRPREEYHDHLVSDYFSDNPLYPPNIFRRRFRMRMPLFLHIVDELGKWSGYFTTRVDALGRQGLTALQKCTAAIRQLANGSAADHLDESLKIGETTSMEAMKYFVEGVIAVFGERYLRHPTKEDAERLLKIGERRGFPGMFGSIDCMHWQWERCPTAWKGQFTRGDQKVPTIILEAVASHDLWIWHAFFGVAGSNNDINVLQQSHLFMEELKGQAPRVQYMVNGNQYNTGYYLADGIYPEWAVFVKSISMPISDKDKLYAQEQEGKRKDIERAFGVLRRRWSVLKKPARLYDRGQLEKVVLACIVLHNMIVEDEKKVEDIEENLDLNEAPSTVTVQEPEFSPKDYVPFERVLQNEEDIRDRSAHIQLKKDLVEHIWNKHRRRRN